MEKLQQDNAAAPSGHNVVERPPQFLRPVTTILTPGDHNPYAHISLPNVVDSIDSERKITVMSKRAGSPHHGGDEPTPKRLRIVEGNHTIQSALYDPHAWDILRKFLTSDMSMGEMDAALESYLGSRFSAGDWEEPRRLLFSGDGDDAQSLANLMELKIKYVPEPEPSCAIPVQQLRKPLKPRKQKNPYILDEAEEEDEDEDEDEEEDEEDVGSPFVRSPKVTRFLNPSAKDRLAATFDDMATRFKQNSATSSHGRQFPIEDRMYLLHVQIPGTATEYVAAHLRKLKFPVTVSAWTPGQLYVVADSPKTISQSLPSSLYLAVKDYTRIKDEECEAVELSRSKLPDTAWVRITRGKYKDDVGRVFKSKEEDFVEVLIATRDFPYKMPQGTRSLVERSRLPNSKAGQVSDIILNGEVVGWSYKGESYYKGLVVKIFARDQVELVAVPHVNDIQLHLESGWDTPFLKATVVAFSMQFLRVGDSARVVKGSLRGELGHLIQMYDDVLHVCQETTKEVIEVSKYYLDRRPLRHTLKSHLPTQQYFEPPSDSDSIEIGDYIQVLGGKHTGRRGIVNWFARGDTNLWFRDIFTPNNADSNLSSISVPASMVQRTDLARTITFTKERGYDVRPGDTVSVARGPECGAQGLVQHVDFPNACLSLICNGDKSIINVPIRFVIKIHNASVDSFKKDIGHEVFIIGSERKGYRGTLSSLSVETCTVAVRGQVIATLKLHDVVTRYGMRLNGVMLQGPELVSFCDMRKRSYLAPPPRSVTPPAEKIPSSSSASITDSSLAPFNGWSTWSSSVDVEHDPSSSVNPSLSSTLQAWSVDALDIRDSIEVRTEKIRDTGPLPWLMSKEFSSNLLGYHILFKVSAGFMHGKLQKRFVSTACPDPFCGENGPAPEGCVAVFCTSNSAGAALQHYHIPASDLSLAPPRKKNQECLILDGIHRGLIRIVSKCEITKKNTVDIQVTPTVTATLRSDQICLVECSRQMMQ
ncbi:hypothetical protein BD769DRAFT_1387344 [Suillus cothurnatus]|nr:hypothetical protein BD769DRAFT_1387344 [Suillus cothurnatus]